MRNLVRKQLVNLLGAGHIIYTLVHSSLLTAFIHSLLSFLLLLKRCKVWVVHRVLRSDSLGVVVSEHAVQQVQGFLGDEALVHMVYEFVPRLLLVNSKNIVVVTVERHVVLLDVIEQVICAEDLCNLY